MELSFCKLKAKEVINICDGRNLGNMTDMIIDSCCGKILGIIVPANKSFFHLFKSNNDIFIPYNHICKIGSDIILVDIITNNNSECYNIDICKINTQSLNDNKKLNIQSILSDINKK